MKKTHPLFKLQPTCPLKKPRTKLVRKWNINTGPIERQSVSSHPVSWIYILSGEYTSIRFGFKILGKLDVSVFSHRNSIKPTGVRLRMVFISKLRAHALAHAIYFTRNRRSKEARVNFKTPFRN